MIVWIVIGLLAALLLLRLAVGPSTLPKRRALPPPEPVEPEDPLDLLAQDAPAALARYGTPEVAEMLEEQGRGHELHGLGYRRDRR